MNTEHRLGMRVLKGLSWVYLAYGLAFICQIVALVVLARLLTPKDFGIFAICLMIANIGETFFRLGLGPSVIQRPNATRDHIDVAWTYNNLFSLLSVAVLAVLTPILTEQVFDSPVAKWPVWLMLSTIPLKTLISPGAIIHMRDLRQDRLFWINVVPTSFRYIGSILLALWLTSYWAMIYAYVLTHLITVALSYVLLRYPVRFFLSKTHFIELYTFSIWLHLNNIINWLSRYLDSFIVGSVLGTTELGYYNRATSVAGLPSQPMSFVTVQIFFPMFALIQGETARINKYFQFTIDLFLLIFCPILIAFIFFSEPIVTIILGIEWLPAAPIISILMTGVFFRTFEKLAGSLFRAVGVPRLEVKIGLLSSITTALFILPLVKQYGKEGAAVAFLIGSVVPIPYIAWKLHAYVRKHDWWHSALVAAISFTLTFAIMLWMFNQSFLTTVPFPVSLFGALLFYHVLLLLFYWGFNLGPISTFHQVSVIFLKSLVKKG